MTRTIITFILAISLSAFSGTIFAQGKGNGNGHGKGNGNGNGNWKNKEVVENGDNGKKQHGPPPWAPANGYRKRHIYFPDYKTYYDNTKGVYISMVNNVWTTSVEIPLPLKNVDLKLAAKVELDLDNIDNPQINFEEHLKLYPPKK